MAELRVHRILLLVICLAKSLESTKLLAELKKCGDLECETLISRVTALRDYEGPDCRYLNFTKGEEISVYVKLAGEREDLWAGSKGKDFGYFPRDAVQIEEVFISEEVQISTKESDFFCLLGGNYIFENEDSELNSDNDDPNYIFEEDEDQISSFYESNFHIDSGFYSASESTVLEDKFLAVETPDDTISNSESKAWEEIETENVEQETVQEETLDHIPEGDHVPPSSAVPDGMGWFALTTEQTDRQTFGPVIEPVQESSFQSRKIAVVDENDLEELNNNEHQRKHNPEPDLEIDAVPDKESEIAPESEHILKPQTTGWFGSGFTSYLGFGDQDTSLELLPKESNQPLQDVPNPIPSDEEPTVPCEEIVVKEDPIINDSSTLKSSWFDFGFGMLGFAHVKEDKITSNGIKNEERVGSDKNEPPPLASEFGLDKEQETEILEVMETEDQIDKKNNLEETDDSDTLPYFNFLYNFDNPWSIQNVPKDKELLFPKQTGDEGNKIENERTEEFSVENDPTDNIMPESSSSTSDLASKIELPVRTQEEIDSQIRSSENNEDESKTLQLTEGYAEVEIYGFVENTQLNSQIFSSDNSVPSQSHISQKEDALEFQILKYLFQINVYDFLTLAFSPILFLKEMVMAVMPEDKGLDSNLYGSSWELMVTCAAIFLTVLLFLRRSFQWVRSRLYAGREQNLALKLSALIDEKCKLLEKYCLIQKECEGLALPVKDVKNGTESADAPDAQGLEAIFEDLNQYKSKMEDEILSLEKELKEENSKHAEQDDLMIDLLENIKSLEEESKSLKSKVAEAKMTFKVFQMNEERLNISIKGFQEENCEIQECQTQLLQEADVWKEKLSELDKQKTTFEDTVLRTEQVLTDKENQIQFLTDRLLNMEGWAHVLTEAVVDDDNLQLGMKSESEDDTHLDEQKRKALEKLIHAAKLNASLKTMEGERDQIYTDLSEVEKTKDELTEYMKNLETEQSSIQSESTVLENDRQRLQNKLEVMTELYQENEVKLHRKLTVEENCRLEKEEKLCKADEKLSVASGELEIYRKQVKEFEEELERTVLSYQAQITSYEKKAHDNWLIARNVERNLNDLKKENAYNRQKLTETEFKCELLEKDPYAVDVPNTTFGREHSPFGPSPLGRPSSETRAFLSPPTLLEGPLRLSPLLPGGGGRGSRGPGNIVNQQDNNEKGESRYDPHRALSDTGSLSPPWEPDRRMMIPLSGQPYPDPAVPAQMQDRFYSNSGRLSGPSELRSFNRPTFDKADGAMSSEVDSGKNDLKDDVNNSDVPESNAFTEREATGPRFVPPPFPPVRSPLLPMDPRGPFIRRGPPFPPPPGNIMYGPPRDYFPPRNIPGSPYPAVPMRNVCPPRGFPHYLPPRPGFYPTNLNSENRSEFPSGSIPPSNEPTTEHLEPQQET